MATNSATPGGTSTDALRVGARVRTHSAEANSENGAAQPSASDRVDGTIVEDFAPYVGEDRNYRDWAVAHRWGVALDNGRLVFRDSGDLEPLGESGARGN